jgi:hypothetical protein
MKKVKIYGSTVKILKKHKHISLILYQMEKIATDTINSSKEVQHNIIKKQPIPKKIINPKKIISPLVDPYYNQYFDKNEVIEFKLNFPCKKSHYITTLRKIGDIKKQYVTNVYYLDTLSFSYDECEIYSSHSDDYSPVYSCYHSECDYCKTHKQKVKDNLIVGYKIYPRLTIPEKTYKQRKEVWKKFI